MSKENHPNFHAIQFAADIMASYFKSLRGAGKELQPFYAYTSDISDDIVDFVIRIEEKVDESVDSQTKIKETNDCSI